MPPQIKADVNRAGWESTDMPSVCEECLGENNQFLQMLKEDYGAECKVCSRPFTLFRWKTDRTSRQKKTVMCLTCARLKNACQHCMRDLQFGLPLVIRDQALKMVSGPTTDLNKQFFAQENEQKLEDSVISEEFNKSHDKATELLRRLAQSEPYYKKQRRLELEAGGGEQSNHAQIALPPAGSGPVRPRNSKLAGAIAARGSSRGGRGGARGGLRGSIPIRPEDIRPPADQNITSLFVSGDKWICYEHLDRGLKSLIAPPCLCIRVTRNGAAGISWYPTGSSIGIQRLEGARFAAREGFESKRSLSSPNAVATALGRAKEITAILRHNIVQGRYDEEKGVYKLNIHDEIERGDNSTIKMQKPPPEIEGENTLKNAKVGTFK